MLQLRPICENCGKQLPPDASDAMICTYECTFCAACARDVLQDVCPNCGGGFEKRPIRPKEMLAKDPATTHEVRKPVNPDSFLPLMLAKKDIPPSLR